jgi:hypothetical protein
MFASSNLSHCHLVPSYLGLVVCCLQWGGGWGLQFGAIILGESNLKEMADLVRSLPIRQRLSGKGLYWNIM